MDLTKEQLQRLKAASCIGKPVHFKNKDGSGHENMGIVLDEVYIIVSDYKHMIQQIRPDEPYWDGRRSATALVTTHSMPGKRASSSANTPNS
jgi:hypothetical protein